MISEDAQTGEDVLSPSAVIESSPALLHNIFAYPDLDDVGYGWTMSPVDWTTMAVSWLQGWYYGIRNHSVHHMRLSEWNVGGESDVRQHRNALIRCCERNPDKDIVLFGCSRGAATTLVSVADKEGVIPNEVKSRIKLIIVEAPFDTVENVVRLTSLFPDMSLTLLETIGKYKPNQTSPLEAVSLESFPMHIPIAFITSAADERVPVSCTMKLIDKLRERGHQYLHHCHLKYSSHAEMSVGDERDRATYSIFLESFHDRYLSPTKQ